MKDRAYFFFDWRPTLQVLAVASLRKLRRKPKLAAENVRENVSSSGKQFLNDKRGEGGCLLIVCCYISSFF